MAKKISISRLITAALLGAACFCSGSRAAGNGVVRVELTKQWIPHQEISELEESDQDGLIEIQI